MKRTPFFHIAILIAFLFNSLGPISSAQAQDFALPAPGNMVRLSPEFDPPILKGIKVHLENPFRFDFILDKGDSQLSNNALKDESKELIKYFLTSLTIPEEDLWVNLSPYEKDRIIPQSFGLTEMGRDLLAEDYMLKQITASLIYPEDEIGKKFWKRVYEEAQKKFSTTNIPVNTFNKVWIVPEKAVVYENAKAGTAYVVESKLKVMLEEDYLSLAKHEGIQSKQAQVKGASQLGSQIVREIIIPELTTEVNENKNFAKLRQVYNSLILATWYKEKIKDSILEQVYADKNKVQGVNIDDPKEKERIYQKYLRAFKKGVFNYIKEETLAIPGLPSKEQRIFPRKYFSGGVQLQLRFGKGMDSAMSIIHNFKFLGKTLATGFLIATASLSPSTGLMAQTPMPKPTHSQSIEDQKLSLVLGAQKIKTQDELQEIKELLERYPIDDIRLIRHDLPRVKYDSIISILNYSPREFDTNLATILAEMRKTFRDLGISQTDPKFQDIYLTRSPIYLRPSYVKKSELMEFESIKGEARILLPDTENSIWEDVSPTLVRIRQNIDFDLVIKALQQLSFSDREQVNEIIYSAIRADLLRDMTSLWKTLHKGNVMANLHDFVQELIKQKPSGISKGEYNTVKKAVWEKYFMSTALAVMAYYQVQAPVDKGRFFELLMDLVDVTSMSVNANLFQPNDPNKVNSEGYQFMRGLTEIPAPLFVGIVAHETAHFWFKPGFTTSVMLNLVEAEEGFADTGSLNFQQDLMGNDYVRNYVNYLLPKEHGPVEQHYIARAFLDLLIKQGANLHSLMAGVADLTHPDRQKYLPADVLNQMRAPSQLSPFFSLQPGETLKNKHIVLMVNDVRILKYLISKSLPGKRTNGAKVYVSYLAGASGQNMREMKVPYDKLDDYLRQLVQKDKKENSHGVTYIYVVPDLGKDILGKDYAQITNLENTAQMVWRARSHLFNNIKESVHLSKDGAMNTQEGQQQLSVLRRVRDEINRFREQINHIQNVDEKMSSLLAHILVDDKLFGENGKWKDLYEGISYADISFMRNYETHLAWVMAWESRLQLFNLIHDVSIDKQEMLRRSNVLESMARNQIDQYQLERPVYIGRNDFEVNHYVIEVKRIIHAFWDEGQRRMSIEELRVIAQTMQLVNRSGYTIMHRDRVYPKTLAERVSFSQKGIIQERKGPIIIFRFPSILLESYGLPYTGLEILDKSYLDAIRKHTTRDASEMERWQDQYNVCILDARKYLMVEDTKELNAKIDPETRGNLDSINQLLDEIAKKQSSSEAMITNQDNLNKDTGGIDLSTANKILKTKNGGIGIKFHINQTQLAQLQKALGFTVGSLTIKPLKSLADFLGLPSQVSASITN